MEIGHVKDISFVEINEQGDDGDSLFTCTMIKIDSLYHGHMLLGVHNDKTYISEILTGGKLAWLYEVPDIEMETIFHMLLSGEVDKKEVKKYRYLSLKVKDDRKILCGVY